MENIRELLANKFKKVSGITEKELKDKQDTFPESKFYQKMVPGDKYIFVFVFEQKGGAFDVVRLLEKDVDSFLENHDFLTIDNNIFKFTKKEMSK